MGKADEEIKKAIDAGQYVVEIRLDGYEEIGRTEYNRPEHFEITDWQAECLARMFLPLIQEFYSHEESHKEFEEWQKEQHDKTDK
jgi:hypothetical protein